MPDNGGVVGDPYVIGPDGTSYDFHGLVGASYLMAGDGETKVSFRIGAVPGSPDKSMVDEVRIETRAGGPASDTGSGPGSTAHVLIVSLSGAILDGTPLTFGAPPSPISSGTCQWHSGSADEHRVDFKLNQWSVAVIQDPGTSDLHLQPSPLNGVLHLGLFIDAMPESGVTGVITEGAPDVPAGRFLVDEGGSESKPGPENEPSSEDEP